MKRIFSLVVALMAMQLMFAAKIQVTNTSGDPTVEGSLPWACENGTSSDTIVFKFSTNGKKVINISNYLSPTASIDGSTYSDSIIIDGSLADGEHVSQGLSRTGAFVKNIVVQNFVTGIRTSYGSKIIGCVIRNNTTDGVLSNNQEIFENCKITNNGDCGIDNYTGGGAGTISSIENCEISGNKLVGIRAGVAVMKKTSILNNNIGLHALNAGDEISDCVISGNDSIGVYASYMYDKFSNNIVGLSKDERTPNPNGVGVLTQGGFENFTDNVISGNRKDGIIDNSRQAFGVFKGNYVGTNRYFDVGSEFGNGGNGFVTSGGAYGCIDEFSDNYFGNNGGYGLYKERVTTSITLSNSYFGVTPNGDPMPNGSGGLNFGPNDLTLDNCHISYNEGNGITYQGVNLIVSGGEIGHNKGYGIDYGLNSNTLRVTNVTFNNNQGSPIHVAATRSIYESLYSCNKFLNTQRSPIDYSYTYPAPQITTCKAEDGVISMAGMVDTAAKAKIELFLTAQGPNNATTFVDSFYTDADGKFTFSLPIKDLGGNSTIDFVATATYDKRHTSTLSAPKSPDYPEIDLTRKSYYVKVDGTGDGSSWEKAMSPQSFASTLPQVRDGVTFYVAEGTYKPVYDHKLGTPSDSKYATYFVKERSNVTIQGGYPAQPEEGAVSDPSKYQAIFDGDILGNDVIDETLDEDGFPSLERTNGEDNVNTMFSPEIENILVLDGVVVKNAGSAVSGCGAYSVITLKNSSFENNGSAVKLYEEAAGERELRIYSCSFVKNTASLFDVDGQSNIVMDSVIIEYNLNSTILNAHYNGYYTIDDTLIVDGDTVIYYTFAGANLSMNRVHVTKNKGMILVDNYSVKVENSEFANNQVAYVFNLGSPRRVYTSEISNCKFLQNKGKAILADSHVLSVDNCLFEGNKGNNLIQITGTSSLRTPNLITNSIVKENESTGSNGSLIYCSSNSNLYMHNNLFTGNVIPENSLLYCYSLDSIAVTNSTFQENDAEYLVEFVGSKKKLIEGNTITRNNTTGYLFHLQSGSTVTTFKNNTVCSNECQSSLIFSGEDPSYLYNNTIVGNKLSNTSKLIDCDDYHTFVHTIGNIILGNSVPNGKTEYLAIRGGSKRNYNIMSYTETDSSNHHCHELPDESNIMSIYDLNAVNNAYPSGVLCRDFLDYASRLKYSPEEILTTLFEGTYDKETNLFTPKLMNNGGPTSTLALKTDKLPDGTSIRFPLTGTVVTTDQRGVARMDSTCMGAYEIGCNSDTARASDTITVGQKFLDKVYTVVGRHDSIFETAQSLNGCDSVVMHTLIVKPDPTKKEYYVKTKRWGKGDGSSWENAMDSIDFATYFPLIEDGTTFYIAEGTYKPIYNSEMKLAEIGTDVAFYVNASFSIRGGYPADAKTGAVSDPKNHPTIFDGDILGNDEIEESMDNDGFMTVKKTKTEDNAIFLFNRGKRETYDYTYDFDGVNFKNTRYVIYCRSWHNYVKISNSEISYNEGPLFFIPYENDALEISNSIFRKNLGQIISTSASSNLKMDSVLFEYNQAGLIRKTATSSGQPTHNVTLNRIYAYSNAAFDIYSMGHNFSMRNSEIKNNIGSLTLYDNSLLESNVFENNKGIISKSGYAGLTIDKCTFIGNSAMTYLSAQKGSNETNYLSIRNSSFINTTADNYLIYASLDSINVDSTVFIDNSGAKISFSSYQFANLSHSKYSDNKNAHLDFSGKSDGETHVNGNSFVGNNSETLFDFSSGPLVTEISNNTIVSNNCEGSFVIYFHGCSPYLYNNTIVGNNSDHPISQVAGSNNEFYGNIILGNGVGEKIQFDYSSGIAFKNNIMPGINGTGCSQEGVANAPENNIVSIFNSEITLCDVFKDIPNRNEEILTALFEGTYDKEKNLFTPVIQDNGGPTPTVALKDDHLADGTSIRFPLTGTVVTTDQRGVERLDSTCMGAYEIGCNSDTARASDTITVGQKFLDKTYTVVGRHDSIFETAQSLNGCDSVVMHTLFVLPDPTKNEYYVKMERHGKGDGSSWDNAMDSVDFATYLPLSPDGTTFYVAEGTYKPVYGFSVFKTGNTKNRRYTINSDVTIRGGYPADATGTDVPSEPKKHLTIFDGDFAGNDVIGETTDENGYINIPFEGTGENVEYMFYSDIDKALHLTFDGINVKKSSVALCITGPEKTVDVLNCSIENTFSSAITFYDSAAVLNVYNTSFIKNSNSKVIYVTRCHSATLDNVLFEDNTGELLEATNLSDNPGAITLNNVKCYNNNAHNPSYQLFLITYHDVYVTNSEFEKNVGALFYVGADEGKFVVDIHGSKFNQNVGNSVYDFYSIDLRIDSCVFSNNNRQNIFGASSGDLSVTNSTFENNAVESTGLIYSVSRNIVFNNNIVKDNKLGGYMFDFSGYSSCDFMNNDIHRNNIHSPLRFNGSGNSKKCTKIIGNSLWNNKTLSNSGNPTNLMNFTSGAYDIEVSNNTIVANGCDNSVMEFAGGSSWFYNNTIIGNTVRSSVLDFYPNNATLRGNIILGNSYVEKGEGYTNWGTETIYARWSILDYKNNILPNFIDAGDSQKNTIDEETINGNIISIFNPEGSIFEELKDIPNRNEEILTALFEGTYDKETNLFTPVIQDNGGPTPTVALKADRLTDGTSIRFPLTETVVTTDQRGETRQDPTCMGAYEIKCSEVKNTVTDTVTVGDPYTLNGIDLSALTAKVGVHTYNDTIKLENDCDSIVNLILAVRPQKKDGGYYVKVDGTGDGSDWLNAMSPEDFATYLPLAYDGDTFHVAAGTYHPFEEIPGMGLGYKVNSSVVLVGGYPDTANIPETQSDPMLYETVLSANVSQKDYFFSYVECSTSPFSSVEDNLSTLIYADEKVNLSIFGMTLSGVYSCDRAAIQLDAAESSLNLEHCVVSKNAATAIKASNGSHITVNECYFNENYTNRAGVFDLSDATLKVTHSTFDHNRVSGTYCPADNIDSVAGVAFLKNSIAEIENSTFTYNNATKGGVFYLDGSNLSLTNVTITGNGNFTDDATDGSVIYSSTNPSDVKLFGNIIVGNGKSVFAGDGLSVSSSNYNIFSQQPSWEMGEKDLLMNDDEMITILDGEINNYYPKSYFQPVLRLVEGYTPIVAVITSTFSGGEVLSILHEDQRVKDDQRGFLRKDTCCIGAYEFPTLTDYYVKVIATGDGSGRNWNNAMSDTTFATYFPIVPNEATFHIAAGTYYPLKDNFGHFANSSQCFYSTTRSINMIGGYPELAKEGDTTDPSVNFTVLSVDHNNDNTVSIVKFDDDYSYININNISDNGYRVIDITPKSSGETTIYGIIFEGSKSIPRGSSSAFSYYGPNEQDSKLTLDHCTFRKSYSAVSISATTVVVNECRFDSIEAYAFSAISYTPAELTLSKSTFNLTGTAVNLREVFNAEISNNTIVDAKTSFEYHNSGFEKIPMNVKMYNNTVSNGANFMSIYNTISEEVKLEAKGNIFNIQKCYFSFYDNTPPAITSDYNIFTSALDSEGNTWKLGEHDVLLQPTDLVGVLDGTYSDEKASFVATLSGNGGFCDNVSLLNVILPDDKSIKMIPTGTTPITDDQRYVKRDEVYCAGSYEVDCSFSNGNLKLVPSNTDFCRDDTVIVKLEGLSKLEANTFKYQWFADNDSVRALDADSNAVKFHLYSHQSNPRLNVTITNACGNDTIISTSVHVNGTGAVPFGGIEENDIVCQNAAQPIELTTNVAGAVFEGECIVNEHFFDPSLATADTSLIRCWVETGECKSFEDKIIHITKSESFVLEEVEGNLNLTCSNEVGYATLQIMSESEDEFDAYFDTKHIGTYKSNDKIEIKAIEKGSHTLFVESKVEVCPASSSIPLNVSAPDPISVILETQGVGCGATVTAFASGETGLYQYVWKDEAGEVLPSTSEVLSGIGAGTYTCIVSSVDCGTKVTEQATIDPVDDKGELSVTFVKTDETCIDGNNGTVTVTLKASNPNEKVTVVLTSDKDEFKKVGSQRGGNIVFDNLPPTQYVMTAYFGSEDCVSAPTDVKETINIAKKTTKLSIASVNSEKNTCLSPLNGYISATVNGWDNGYVALLNDTPVEPSNVEGEVATFKLESVSAGDYVFYVEDNCKTHSDSKNVSISSIDPYKLEIVKYTDTLDCAKSLMGYAQFKKEGGNEENSSVYIVGKTGWSSLNEDQIVLVSGNYFANLKKDQYTLYYKSNLEGCLDADSLKLTVKGPDTLAADYVISCKEDETVIKVTASGENGEYKYRWNGGDFSLETDDPILAPSSLEYGLEYTCEVRDSKGCDKKSFTFSFVHPDKLKELKMRYSLDPQSCIGVPNAKIYAVAAQKEDKYEATFVLMNVDDNSVVKKLSVSQIESAICFSDLPVGNYQLKLRYGGEDCEMGGPSILSDTIKVEPLLPLKGQLGETTGLTCLNEPNGKAEISLSSGWSKHHISTLLRKKENKWDVYNESLDATSSEGQSALYEINGLEGGSYQFIIKDDCGKDSMKFSFDVSDFEPYSIQLVNKTKFLDCYTDDTAHIEVNVSGGYFFDNEFYLAGVDTLSITKAENFKYTDLTAGLYHFHYGTTQEGCSDSVMLDVEIETDSIFVNLDNSGEMCYDAKLQATVKGGKEPYTLVWGNENADSIRTDNAQPFVLENVGVANYFATVVDKIGCKAQSETVFAQLVGDMSKENGLRIDSISLNALQCLFPSENGDIRVFVVGNTYRANVSVKVKRDNNLVNEVTTSAESDTITFDGLPFDQTYQLSVSFQGAEECAAGNDNLNRSILLTKPEPFSVDFTATKVLCENSHDAEIASNIHAGAHTYHYEWHKVIEDKEDEIITHDVLTSDTLRDLRKEERYFCKVVDQNFCESLSDTFTIGYSKADTMQLDTFEYDERQRCKGVDNAHMYVSFNKVAPWVNAQFDLSVVDGDALDKQDQDENNDRIHINELGPNKYHLIAGYGVEGCPTLLDTIVEIFEMVGDLKVAANPDSTHDALCVSTKDGAIYFHLDGVAKKQVVEIYDEEDNFLKKVQQDSLSVERGFYKLTGLLAGTYKVKVTNDCDVKDASTYTLGGYNKYELALEEDKSHLSLQCPYSEDGAIAFSIIGHESNFTLNFMTYDTTIIDNYKDSIIVSDCVIRDSTRMKDTIYTMYNRDETSVSVHSSVAPKMETKVIDDQTVYNYYLSVDSILGEVDTFAVVKELLPGSGVQYKYTVKEKSGAIKWELSNISIVDTIAPTEQDGDTLYRFHTMVDSLVCVRDTDNMKMTWNYVMDPNNDTLFLYQYYEIPTKCFDTISVIAGKVVQYHPVLNELDANDATLKDGIYYFTNFKKGDYYIKAKTTMENCPDADTMNVKITAPNDVLLTKEILPVSCRSKNDGSVSLKPYRVGSEDGVLYFGRDSILFKSNYKANYLYKRSATKHDQNGDDYTTYDYKNVIFNGDTVMVNINDLSNYSSYFVKKHDGSNVSVTPVAVDGNVDQATLFGGDIVSVDWKRMNDAGIWEKINDQIVWPASTDSLEETYFSSNGDTIKGLVWGASHLETFWDDHMGTYQEVGAQTVANMSPAKYSVHVTDAVGCVYDFDFEVKEPEDALKIESVEYNASLALCKPEERHIFVRASGGWGYYKYSFSAEADTSIGYVVDKYHGGEAYSYDPTANTGWGRSACLVDGIYKVSVFDDKGCIVTVNDPIEVKSLVKVTADTSATLCPGVISAPITLNVSNTNNYSGTYTVKEYLSACGTEISSCINDSFPTVLEHTSVDNLALTVGPGRHGYLVYEDDNNACGGYVEVVVLDTIRPMDISKKSIDSVKCYGNNDGAIFLYLKGGTSPYTLSYDKFWFDEKENQLKDAHESRTYTKSQLNLILNNIEKSDGTIVVDSTYSVDINNLSAAKYCFTIVDANGCVRSLGVDGSIDTLTVRQPDSMHIDVYASGLCPDKAGLVTDNIAVFGQNAKGGIPPYLYYAVKKGETGEFSDNSYFDLPVHTNDIVTYAFKDANQCQYEKDIVVDPKPIPVERYDFILSTWSKRNDVVALIDLCAPDVAFDSVTYFINDESVEVLDKRMYIYDVHAPQNKELYEELSKVNTKTEVSDMFFQKHFNLCVDSALAKHIQFIRRNNLVTYTWNANLNRNVVKDSLKPKNDSIWVQDEIRMRAYFRGCAYDVTRNGCFIIATDNYQIYNGGLSGETDILDLQLYPNPFVRTEQDECQIRVTVASKTEGDIYLYTLDGKTADNQTGLMRTHFNANEESGWQQLAGSLYNRPDQPYVYQKTFVVKADDLKSGAEAIVVLVRTANDAKSTYLLVK